ncbi:LOW QUALITY PROTEIN: doublesex- and mab-3-related transcription factor C2-like [Rousettus aegyptiacus]|nr:doublesex- and mab-3-related transcription factor C2 [Rousettus aegyptiacus]XP_015995655.2 doublesex- and mab-3-related transcription factor C2 [Rousettus aegyptiacus]XP_036083096.1 LOW QUALITY PROTEIN: doublesex- and mab-3-related transcription factor C2-like [Rousettus aegyptiacus]
MDPSELSAVPCCPTDSSTGLDTTAPWGIKLRPRRAVNRCARCHNHGATDQIKDHKHLCLFQTCKCRKCARFSEHCKVAPAESAFKRQRGAHGKRRLTRGLRRTGAAPPREHNSVDTLAIQGGVLNTLPSGSTGWSGPRFFVSVLDSSSLEEATDNFSLREFTQAPWPAQHAPVDSDQASGSASSEWQRKLEAAEALLILRDSPRAPPDYISPL